MAFARNSWQRAMMADFYTLFEKWWGVPYTEANSRELWDSVIADTDDFVRKYNKDDNHIAAHLATIILSLIDDQSRGRRVLCDTERSMMIEAMIGFYTRRNGDG